MTETESCQTASKPANNTIKAPAISQNPIGVLLPVPLMDFSESHEPRPAIVFRSEHLGSDNPVLGDQLMAEFLDALKRHPEPPMAMLFYNTAVHLVLESSLVLETIRQLAARGCEVLACKTSLQMLAPGQAPAVGNAVSMAELVDRMRQARQLLWP